MLGEVRDLIMNFSRAIECAPLDVTMIAGDGLGNLSGSWLVLLFAANRCARQIWWNSDCSQGPLPSSCAPTTDIACLLTDQHGFENVPLLVWYIYIPE
jgi:hypothetical protein